MLSKFWIAQIIGVIALLLTIYTWNRKNRSEILITQCVSSIVYIIHYVLLSAFTGAIMNALVIGRNLTFDLKHKKQWAKHPGLLFGFILILCAGGALSWQGPISIMGTLGTIVGTYGMWQNDPWKMRFYIFIACAIWIPYTIVVHSYSGLISQLVAMFAILIAKYRHGREEIIAESH